MAATATTRAKKRGGARQGSAPGFVRKKIDLDKIHLDPAVQSREKVNEETVTEYAEAMKQGAEFPAIDVYGDDEAGYWPGDGHHRVRAAREAGWRTIIANVWPGGRTAAMDAATAANISHGLRRTNADKRKAVRMALELDRELGRRRSNNAVARHCGVSDMLVADVRQSLPDSGSQDTVEYTTRHGTTATMRTGNIGRPRPRPLPEEPAGAAVMAAAATEAGLGPETAGEADGGEEGDGGGVVVDGLGLVVTDPVAAEAIARAPEFKAIINRLHALKREVVALAELPIGRELRIQQIVTDFKNIVTAVEFGAPYCPCPFVPNCDRKGGCKHCHGSHWLSKDLYTTLAPEVKKVVHDRPAAER